jgi:hypothetical protein
MLNVYGIRVSKMDDTRLRSYLVTDFEGLTEFLNVVMSSPSMRKISMVLKAMLEKFFDDQNVFIKSNLERLLRCDLLK